MKIAPADLCPLWARWQHMVDQGHVPAHRGTGLVSTLIMYRSATCHFVLDSKDPVFEGSPAQPCKGRHLAHIPTLTPSVSLCPRYMRMVAFRFTVPG